ncbi:MAG: carbon monoxide dehydrogenase [Lentisphaerae bacterium]|nr:carbon monoxide dehydrogenase [Lentisphaerota bacterium]
MKIAVSGKGGVGKTTISALIAYALRDAGHRVIAIDADPDSNLLACMGYPRPDSVRPLVELRDLIEERTGVKPGTVGGMYKLNPRVDDLPDRYAVDVDGIKVLVAGAVKKGGSGCYCPENALVRTLVAHLLLDRGSALVLDMEAGVEHLGRGTVEAVDRLLIVVEPGRRSVETASRIRALAADLGLAHVGIVGNKIRGEADLALLRGLFPDADVAGAVPYDERLREAEIGGRPARGASPEADRAVAAIVTRLNG